MANRLWNVGARDEDQAERRGPHPICQPAGRPTQPVTTSIAAAIDRMIADIQAGDGPEIEFYDDVPIDELPPELQTVVFPIVQELLLNACRHSKSKNMLVGLGQDEGHICIQVQDWGIGFDPERVQLRERGLKALRQLVQWQGGTVDVDSRPGAGTCIIVEIPFLPEPKPSDQMGDRRPK